MAVMIFSFSRVASQACVNLIALKGRGSTLRQRFASGEQAGQSASKKLLQDPRHAIFR